MIRQLRKDEQYFSNIGRKDKVQEISKQIQILRKEIEAKNFPTYVNINKFNN